MENCVAFKKVSSDVFQKRGELRPPHPLAATRLTISTLREAGLRLAADSAERSATRACACSRNPAGCGANFSPPGRAWSYHGLFNAT